MVRAVASARQQTLIPGENRVSLPKDRDHSDRNIEGVDGPSALSSRKKAISFITGWNTHSEIAFDIACGPEGFLRGRGYIPSGYSAAIVRKWLDWDPVIRLGGRDPAAWVLRPLVNKGSLKHGYGEDLSPTMDKD